MELDFSKFAAFKERLVKDVDVVLGSDLPRLLESLPREVTESVQTNASPLQFDEPMYKPPRPALNSSESTQSAGSTSRPSKPSKTSSAIVKPKVPDNPWGASEDDDDEPHQSEWILQSHVSKYQAQFNSIATNGLANGGAVKGILVNSKLGSATLRSIWELSDIDKDGSLDIEEFTVAMVLVEQCKAGSELPDHLDENMIPLSKRMMHQK